MRVRVPVFGGTAHYYLNDMVLELGPTLVIPGSHRAGRPPADESSWNGNAPCAAMVKAGSVVLFRNEVWHGAAMNSSTEKRYIMQVPPLHVNHPPPVRSVLNATTPSKS